MSHVLNENTVLCLLYGRGTLFREAHRDTMVLVCHPAINWWALKEVGFQLGRDLIGLRHRSIN